MHRGNPFQLVQFTVSRGRKNEFASEQTSQTQYCINQNHLITMRTGFCSSLFVCSQKHQLPLDGGTRRFLCQEIIVAQPFNFNLSSERGRAWEEIACALNEIQRPSFRVSSRSVRDRYSLLVTKRAHELREEEKAYGIGVTCTELDAIVKESLEREKEAKGKIQSDTQLRRNELKWMKWQQKI